jgi:hypothetical protein
MVLMLPTPLFYVIMLMLQLMPPDNVSSPCLNDLNDRRSTSVDWILGDILETGRRFNVKMLICQAVHQKIKELEGAMTTGNNSSNTSQIKHDPLHDIDVMVAEVKKLYGKIPSYDDLLRLVFKIFLGLLLIYMALYAIIVLDW